MLQVTILFYLNRIIQFPVHISLAFYRDKLSLTNQFETLKNSFKKNKRINMKVVIAIDSLKGSLSSMEAGQALRRGVLAAKPDADVIVKPLADGGEGTTEALVEGLGGEEVILSVTGPLGLPVPCTYGYLKKQNLVIIEMA